MDARRLAPAPSDAPSPPRERRSDERVSPTLPRSEMLLVETDSSDDVADAVGEKGSVTELRPSARGEMAPALASGRLGLLPLPPPLIHGASGWAGTWWREVEGEICGDRFTVALPPKCDTRNGSRFCHPPCRER